MKFMVAALMAGFIAGSLATAANAHPSLSENPTVTEQVTFADLDLRSASGQKRLEDRISFAAYRLCLMDSPASPSPAVADSACFRKAKIDAAAQAHRVIAAAENHPRVASASAQHHR